MRAAEAVALFCYQVKKFVGGYAAAIWLDPLKRERTDHLALAFGCLAWSFIANDFSVQNVATNSNSELPLHYRIAATWGSHEGSLLLWALILAVWTAAVARFSKRLPPEVIARVLGVMGLVAVGFLAFLLFTSNPFERLLPAALDDDHQLFGRQLRHEPRVERGVPLRLDLAAALWAISLESELVFVADVGTTQASDPTDRYGLDLEARFQILPHKLTAAGEQLDPVARIVHVAEQVVLAHFAGGEAKRGAAARRDGDRR